MLNAWAENASAEVLNVGPASASFEIGPPPSGWFGETPEGKVAEEVFVEPRRGAADCSVCRALELGGGTDFVAVVCGLCSGTLEGSFASDAGRTDSRGSGAPALGPAIFGAATGAATEKSAAISADALDVARAPAVAKGVKGDTGMDSTRDARSVNSSSPTPPFGSPSSPGAMSESALSASAISGGATSGQVLLAGPCFARPMLAGPSSGNPLTLSTRTLVVTAVSPLSFAEGFELLMALKVRLSMEFAIDCPPPTSGLPRSVSASAVFPPALPGFAPLFTTAGSASTDNLSFVDPDNMSPTRFAAPAGATTRASTTCDAETGSTFDEVVMTERGETVGLGETISAGKSFRGCAALCGNTIVRPKAASACGHAIADACGAGIDELPSCPKEVPVDQRKGCAVFVAALACGEFQAVGACEIVALFCSRLLKCVADRPKSTALTTAEDIPAEATAAIAFRPAAGIAEEATCRSGIVAVLPVGAVAKTAAAVALTSGSLPTPAARLAESVPVIPEAPAKGVTVELACGVRIGTEVPLTAPKLVSDNATVGSFADPAGEPEVGEAANPVAAPPANAGRNTTSVPRLAKFKSSCGGTTIAWPSPEISSISRPD